MTELSKLHDYAQKRTLRVRRRTSKKLRQFQELVQEEEPVPKSFKEINEGDDPIWEMTLQEI